MTNLMLCGTHIFFWLSPQITILPSICLFLHQLSFFDHTLLRWLLYLYFSSHFSESPSYMFMLNRIIQKKILVFRAVLSSQENWKEVTDSPRSPAPRHAYPLPLSVSPTIRVHLLQLINLHWYITITQSPEYTLGSTLSVVYLPFYRYTFRTSYLPF